MLCRTSCTEASALFLLTFIVVVVELDPPYNSRFQAQYGDNFKKWEPADYGVISRCMAAVLKPMYPTVVVPLLSLLPILLVLHQFRELLHSR